MNATIVRAGGKAKSSVAGIGTQSPDFGNVSHLISELMKSIFTDKPWAYVAAFIGITPRAAKHKIYGSARYSDDEIAALLQSEHGRQVLAVLMGEAKPRWYLRLLQQDAVTDARILNRRTQRRLEEQVRLRDEYLEAMERAETSLAVQDEAFHRPSIDGLREARSVSNRAVASSLKINK